MTKVLKKINTVYINAVDVMNHKGIYVHRVTEVIEEIRKLSDYTISLSSFEMLHSEIAEADMDNIVIGFNVIYPNCANLTIALKYDCRENVQPEDISNFQKFSYFTEPKKIQKFLDVFNLSVWVKSSFDIRQKFIQDHEKKDLSSKELSILIAIQNENKIYEITEAYNRDLMIMLDNNKWYSKCLSNKIGFELGYSEVASYGDNIEELNIYLHVDSGSSNSKDSSSKYFKTVSSEGTYIFSDCGLSYTSAFNDEYVKNIANIIDNTIHKCSTIQSCWEVSNDGNFEYDDSQRFISIIEFECAVKRQLYNLTINADKIFKNLYHLIRIIELQIDLEEE